jgi:hypothetical protein
MRPSILKKKKKKKKSLKNYSTYGFCTKLLIKLLYSIFSNKFCTIDIMANPFNLYCDIVDHK